MLTNSSVPYDDYSLFLLDLWGVIHDGTKLYPQVIETLKVLREKNKKIIFLSNAPRRAEKAVAKLEEFGITADMYDAIITSGEAAWLNLKDSKRRGQHYYYLGPSKDEDVLDKLPYANTEYAEEADFILCTGFEYDFQPEEEIEPTLAKLMTAELPMICINPDLEVVKQDGTRQLCAGWVARRYEELGGKVQYFGKPHPDVYGLCLIKYINITHRKVLAVGDNLLTDIAGAAQMEIDSVLVSGGILAESGTPLEEHLRAAPHQPTYVVERFADII